MDSYKQAIEDQVTLVILAPIIRTNHWQQRFSKNAINMYPNELRAIFAVEIQE